MPKKSFSKELEKLDKEDLVEIIDDLANISSSNYHFLEFNLSDHLDATFSKKIFDSYKFKLSEMFMVGRNLIDFSFLMKDIRIYLKDNMKIFRGDKILILQVLYETQLQLITLISQKKVLNTKNQRWIILLFEEIYFWLDSVGNLTIGEKVRFETSLNSLKSIHLQLFEVLNYKFVHKIKKGT